MKLPSLWCLSAPRLLALLWGLVLGFASIAQAAETTFLPSSSLVQTHRQGPETNPADRLFPGPTIDVGDHDDSAGHGTVQGFVGFDLTTLPASQITNARLTLRAASAAQGGHITGDPFRDGNGDSLPDRGDIFVERALNTGGAGVGFFNLNLGAPNTNIHLTRSVTQTSIWTADVSSLVQSAKAAGDTFVVFRLRFRDLRDNDNQIDLASFEPLSLLVTTNNVTPHFEGSLDPSRTTVGHNQFITYTLNFRAVGGPATNARVSVTVPQHTTFSPGGITDPRFTGTGNTRVANLGSFNAGVNQLVRFDILVNPNAPFGTVLRPFVIIQADNLPSLSGQPQQGVTVIKPHLEATVTVNRTSVAPGETVTYTLRGRVVGGRLIRGRIDFSLYNLPLTLSLAGTSTENLVQSGTGSYSYAFEDLGSGQEFTRTVALRVNDAAPANTSFRLPVVVVSRPPNQDPDAVSLTEQVPLVSIRSNTALVIVAAAPKFIDQGQTLTYTLTVGNKGDLAATNVRVFGDIPPGTTYVAGSARFQLRQGTTSLQSDDVVFTLGQALPAGQAAVMRYSVRVSDKFRGRFGNSLLNRNVRAFANNIDAVPSAQVRTGIGAGGDIGLALQDFIGGVGGAIGGFFKGIGDAIGGFFSGLFGGGATKPGAAPDTNAPPEVRRLIDSNGLSIGVGGAPIVAVGGANIVALGGNNIIANGGGNVIALGGANVINGNGSTIVAVGGGNVINGNGSAIIAVGGANIIAVGGANLAPITAAQLVGLNGSNALPPAPGTQLVGLNGSNLLSGNNIVANGGGNIVALGGNNLTAAQKATIVALGGGNIIANGGNN